MDNKKAQINPQKRTTVVFVTDQFQCERIITAGRKIADVTHCELCVYSVNSQDYKQNPEALQFLYDVSKQNAGEMTVMYENDVVKGMSEAIKAQHTINVVTGAANDENSVLYKIWNKFVYINFFTVDSAERITEVDTISKVAR